MPDIPRLRSAIKTRDGWWASIFAGPAANRLLEPIADIQWITPNIITISSLVIGIIAAYCFCSQAYILGAILVQLSFVVDCMDGQLARYRQQFSKLGAWLDRISDRVKDFLYFFALALGFYQTHPNHFKTLWQELYPGWYIWPLAMIASFTVFLIDYYVNQDMKLETRAATGHCEEPQATKQSPGSVIASEAKQSPWLCAIKPILELGKLVYKYIPILRFNIGEQALLISLFAAFSRIPELLLLFATLGTLYSIYWPVAKYLGYTESKT